MRISDWSSDVCSSDLQDYSFRLEADAPLGANDYVQWTALAFQMELSGFEEGQVPFIQVTLSNVSREITKYLEQAIVTLDPIALTYRPYLASDPSGPQMNPPIHMTDRKSTRLNSSH